MNLLKITFPKLDPREESLELANPRLELQSKPKKPLCADGKIIGLKFGRLKVLEIVRISQKRFVRCLCDCGKVALKRLDHVRSLKTQSCGCLQSETARINGKLTTRHGHATKGSISSTYISWNAMKTRCTCPGSACYKNYGGRGIKVCEQWKNFETFLSDMGIRPTGTSIDRIDNNLGYSKENCRWANPKQQASNRRVYPHKIIQPRDGSHNHILTINGVSLCLEAWAEKSGLKSNTILTRFRRGWPNSKLLDRLAK